MRAYLNSLGIALLLGAVLTQFTNCDGYQAQTVSSVLEKSCFEEDNCFDSDENFLKIEITTENDQSLGAVQWTNVSGKCNEGGFDSHQIRWKLYDSQGGFVWDHMDPNHGAPLDGLCKNGKFDLLIHFPNVGISEQHYVEVELVAFDVDKREYRNTLLAKKKVYIIP